MRQRTQSPRKACFEADLWVDCWLAKLTVRFASSHHFLAVAVECVVDNGLHRNHFVVVLQSKMPETLDYRVESGGFGLVPERVVGVGAIGRSLP